MSLETDEIIRALKCSASTTPAPDEACRECRYSIVEDWNGEPHISCDCDKIALDTADRMENLIARKGCGQDGI